MAGGTASARTARPQEGIASPLAPGEDILAVSGRLIAGPALAPAG